MHNSQQIAKKIVWAVDPLAEDRGLQKRCIAFLRSLNARESTTIEPVYVLSPDQLKLSSQFFPVKVGEIRLEAEKRLSEFLKRAKIPGVMSATVIVSEDLSVRSAVNAIVKYSLEIGAQSIVVSTMARKGIKRFLLGSFAESLILQSKIPIFAVSPRSRVGKRIQEILFPTDLSEKSKEVLQKVVGLARWVGGRITLFHQVEYLSQFTVDQFGVIPSYQQFLKEDTARRQKTANAWRDEILRQGVPCRAVVNTNGSFPVDAILKRAKRDRVDIVAMASQTGPVASALLGSVTRQIIRAVDCPIWVIHPEPIAIQKDKPLRSAAGKGTVIL